MARIEGTEGTEVDEIRAVDGFFRGPQRAPTNRALARARQALPDQPRRPVRSIHDDVTAQQLGFRGGTIAGSIHMDQFPPVLLRAFGQSWFERGSLSLNFRHATISDEPVIAMVAAPSAPPAPADVQVAARMEQPDRTLVAEGTASVGDVSEPSHLSVIDLRPGPRDELRILAGVEAGQPLAEHEDTLDTRGIRARIDAGAMTEPLDWYTGDSPWGGAVVNPSMLVQLLRNRPGDFGTNVANVVGLFGAIEIRHHHGPVLFGTPYSVSGEIVAVGASPKTEYVWYDTRAADEDGRVVASMRMQLRWMKASSPLYQEP